MRAVTVAFFVGTGILLLGRMRAADAWDETFAFVDRVAIVRSGDPDDSRAPGERFEIEVTYRYTVDGMEYTGTRLRAFDWIYPEVDGALRDLERLGVVERTSIPVLVNPRDPAEAVIGSDIPWHRFEVIGGAFFLFVLPGAAFAVALVRLLRDLGILPRRPHND